QLDVTVGGSSITDLQLTLERNPTVSGRVVYEGAAAAPDSSDIIIGLVPIGSSAAVLGDTGPTAPDSSGQFRFEGVPPGRYQCAVSRTPAGWSARSLLVNGKDALDTPIDIMTADLTNLELTMRERAGEISGTLRDGDGKPTRAYTAILFPKEPEYWL